MYMDYMHVHTMLHVYIQQIHLNTAQNVIFYKIFPRPIRQPAVWTFLWSFVSFIKLQVVKRRSCLAPQHSFWSCGITGGGKIRFVMTAYPRFFTKIHL